LVALGSPLVAFVGLVTNLASIAGAFGVGKWIFQDGHLPGLLGFAPQGYVDAWGPLLFGAMLSGVATTPTGFCAQAALAAALAPASETVPSLGADPRVEA
jgi:RND superfamily putative drug exporter